MDMIAPMSPLLDVSFGVLTKISIVSFTSQENLFCVLSQCMHIQQLDIDGSAHVSIPTSTNDGHIPSQVIIAESYILQWF